MSLTQNSVSIEQKSLSVNLDPSIYGSFAEIGAGQEVARHFFVAGKASGTIAKSISAYDMAVSDSIYGREENGRYVCESRLLKMLDHEFSLLTERLTKIRGENTKFFAFANTVTTSSLRRKSEAHGWMGVRFQTTPMGKANDIVLHVRMLNRMNHLQQEAIGILGVNLVHSMLKHLNEPDQFITHLLDFIGPLRIEIDMIRFSGPDLAHIDNRLMALRLIECGLTNAVVLSPNNQVEQVSEVLFQKNALVLRGNFSPLTNVHLDMLSSAERNFSRDFEIKNKDLIIFNELSMHHLIKDGDALNKKDFLDRVDTMLSTGNKALITNFFLFSDLKKYLRSKTKQAIGLILGGSLLPRLFEAQHYTQMEGGLLQGIAELFDDKTKLYIYPQKHKNEFITSQNFQHEKEVHYLVQHLLQNQKLRDLVGCSEAHIEHHSLDVLKLIQNNDPSWKNYVPKTVIKLIEERKLFQK